MSIREFFGDRPEDDGGPMTAAEIAEAARRDALCGRGGPLEWSDELGHRERRAWLLLVRGDEIRVFSGESIPGWVAVVGSDYARNGKWSHTTFRLELPRGVRPICGRDGWETGRFVEGLRNAVAFGGHIDNWSAVANALGVSVAGAQGFLREWRPRAAAQLDAVDVALDDIDAAADAGACTIRVSFGSPTRRLRERGFWSWPVVVRDTQGTEIGRLEPDEHGTYRVISGGVRLLDATRASGHGGGYVSLVIAAPEGATAAHEEQRSTP